MGPLEKLLVDVTYLAHKAESGQAPSGQKLPSVLSREHIHLVVDKAAFEIPPGHIPSSKLGLGLKRHVPKIVLHIKTGSQEPFFPKGAIRPQVRYKSIEPMGGPEIFTGKLGVEINVVSAFRIFYLIPGVQCKNGPKANDYCPVTPQDLAGFKNAPFRNFCNLMVLKYVNYISALN